MAFFSVDKCSSCSWLIKQESFQIDDLYSWKMHEVATIVGNHIKDFFFLSGSAVSLQSWFPGSPQKHILYYLKYIQQIKNPN